MLKLPKLMANKIIARVQFKPSLKFYDLMFGAAQRIEGFRDWETDRFTVTLKDVVHRASVRLNHHMASYEQDGADENAEALHLASMVDNGLPGLDLDHYVRFEYERRYVVPVDSTFEQLANVMQVRLFRQDRALTDVLAEYFTDFSYRLDYFRERNHFLVTAAPVWKQQAIQLLEFNRSHLSPENPERDYADAIAKYPECGVYVAVRIHRQSTNPYQPNYVPYEVLKDLDHSEALPFFNEARDEVQRTVSGLLKCLFD